MQRCCWVCVSHVQSQNRFGWFTGLSFFCLQSDCLLPLISFYLRTAKQRERSLKQRSHHANSRGQPSSAALYIIKDPHHLGPPATTTRSPQKQNINVLWASTRAAVGNESNSTIAHAAALHKSSESHSVEAGKQKRQQSDVSIEQVCFEDCRLLFLSLGSWAEMVDVSLIEIK